MTHDWTAINLLAWTGQAFLLAAVGALLPVLFRIRHPRTKLAYCHTVLIACLLLPWLQRWQPATGGRAIPHTNWILWAIGAGVAARFIWLLVGLWRIRQSRIASLPMYPTPESVRAASAVTQADAVFCVSQDIPGPVMLGWLAPVVLLPESFLSLGEDEQCGVACHELLHVRRHDWMVTVLEEVTGAVLWFNPAIWPLLAQTRLAREQLVDAEVVRLTASREPYIDALLAIARGGSGLDLAPAPLFLRRRHLTQRIHSLIKESKASTLRLGWSYASIAAILACAGWTGATLFPLTIQAAAPPPSQAAAVPREESTASETAGSYIPSAEVPRDPYELVMEGARLLQSDAEQEAAHALLDRAMSSARLTGLNSPPYRYDVSFTASTGAGRLTEIRVPGIRRWTADLAGYSVTRWIKNNWSVQDVQSSNPPVVPMRIQELRDAIDWPDRNVPKGQTLRAAAAMWNGRPVTCLLFSKWRGPATLTPSRLWEETENCIDDATGMLQIDSVAPGTYTIYGYTAGTVFHYQPIADRISIYTNGAMVADAQIAIADLNPADESLLTPGQGQTTSGPFVLLEPRQRTLMNVPAGFAGAPASSIIQPVIVQAEIDGNGNVVEEELCAASTPALAQEALILVRNSKFPHQPWNQHQLYVNVRFMPAH